MRSRRPTGRSEESGVEKKARLLWAAENKKVLVIQLIDQLLLDQPFQYVDVDDVPGLRVDGALHGHVHLVVVPVVVGVAAHPEDLLIPLIGAGRIIETVRRIEMDAPGDGGDGHSDGSSKE